VTVDRLDRWTLVVGTMIATVITVYSYAISSVSLYSLGRASGLLVWQAPGVPAVADGVTTYGMFRVVSRSRRRDRRGTGYGWLLVVCGTAASVLGNIAHAEPNLTARVTAACFPAAVLAMLEALKGDVRALAGVRTPAAAGPRPSQRRSQRLSPLLSRWRRRGPHADLQASRSHVSSDRPTVPPDVPAAVPSDVPGTPAPPSGDSRSAQQRLQDAWDAGHPAGDQWTAGTLAAAASVGRATAGRFLAARRDIPNRPPALNGAGPHRKEG
jgi:hypothetical protein